MLNQKLSSLPFGGSKSIFTLLNLVKMDAKDAVCVTHADTVDENLKVSHVDPVGTVRLIDHSEVVLIPTPSPDPRGRISPPESYMQHLIGFKSIEPSAMAQMGHNFHSQSL